MPLQEIPCKCCSRKLAFNIMSNGFRVKLLMKKVLMQKSFNTKGPHGKSPHV